MRGLRFGLVMGLAVGLSGCGGDPSDEIVGTWKMVGRDATATFEKDGSLTSGAARLESLTAFVQACNESGHDIEMVNDDTWTISGGEISMITYSLRSELAQGGGYARCWWERDKATASLEDDVLVVYEDGIEVATFKKQQ